ncbi:winged helix-turn-helix transcriptional regulator [Halorarum salinum]|uniref:MarR family transcriptional regulator n=1 Tax=Halorarum salinum TaxID=2743089 RepID=A0A7D5QGB4_9EURY|nr:winged helix-turn-helix transcriptional regulator [Halobaculum salinum]QLG61344.1 MarR family transcriptional regulator [Halobaculum salinum]
MRLVEPTDFEVLAFLESHGRNNAINISTGLDRDRSYVNTRLRALEDLGLVERVGPATNSGLYELSARGRAALSVRDRYREAGTDFEALVEATLADE